MPKGREGARADVGQALRRHGVTDIDDSPLTRSVYSSDASLYRVEPLAVIRPRSTDEVIAALAACREVGVPLTARGAGTSIAGNAIGPGVVIDFSRHLDQIHEVRPDERVAVVDPGVVLASLQKATGRHGLRFGPDPSTHNRATLGGMIGNNACGSRALGYGRTSDNVRALRVLTASGEVLDLDRTPSPSLAPLADLVADNLATVRTEFGRFPRQISGYALEHLLPENGFDVTRFLVGSEGTLAVVLRAELDLVAAPQHTLLVALGYADLPTAAESVPALLAHRPIACEGIDARIVNVVRDRRGPSAVPPLPPGGGWLLVELGGPDPAELRARAHAVIADAQALGAEIAEDPAHAAALWRIREDGAGLSARNAAGQPAYAGWEDSAVPVAGLSRYLREFDDLLETSGLTGVPYGHLGDGCLHIRIDFPLTSPGGEQRMQAFLRDAADLVVAHGGSLSGEHGDGRARSELLSTMYSPAALALMGQVKAFFDPATLLNPGVLVDPAPLNADLRTSDYRPVREHLALHYADDHGDFAAAVHRCTGVGKCRAGAAATAGVMCPSFQATRDEKDSTRARARVLQDAMDGRLGPDPWQAPEIAQVLDLCLSCRGCASDCPTGVDMATYKAEALHQRYRRRLRPRSHYSLGRLPSWNRLAGLSTRLTNAVLAGPLAGTLKRAAGVDSRRSLPRFAPTTFRSQYRDVARAPAPHGAVVLWVDPFTDRFCPEVGLATVRVLQRAGYDVRLSSPSARCALTWISTGQLDQARRIARRTVAELLPAAQAGIPIVGMEPSSTAVLRSDIRHLLGSDDARVVSGAVRTLAEVLRATPGWTPPDLRGREVLAQPHCHHHAVMGWESDAALLAAAGATVTRVPGCCGLAGNWGMEQGHYDVSVAVAESNLLPAVRAKAPDTLILADGFSCRTQLDDLVGQPSLHLAQLLDAASP